MQGTLFPFSAYAPADKPGHRLAVAAGTPVNIADGHGTAQSGLAPTGKGRRGRAG